MTQTKGRVLARTVLSRMCVPSAVPWQPVWSSLLLQETVCELVEEVGIGDTMAGFFTHLGNDGVILTPLVASFVLDVIKETFVPNRQRYEAEDFTWLVTAVNEHCLPAQGYFALHALPQVLVVQCRAALIQSLSTTPYADEARTIFEP